MNQAEDVCNRFNSKVKAIKDEQELLQLLGESCRLFAESTNVAEGAYVRIAPHGEKRNGIIVLLELSLKDEERHWEVCGLKCDVSLNLPKAKGTLDRGILVKRLWSGLNAIDTCECALPDDRVPLFL